jgi:hypothetical protein
MARAEEVQALMSGRRFSFVLPLNAERQLLEIEKLEGLANPSEAVRHAIRICHEQLKTPGKSGLAAAERKNLEKILIIQKHILVEISKLHNGQARLSAEGQAYLEELNRKVKEHLKQVGHD